MDMVAYSCESLATLVPAKLSLVAWFKAQRVDDVQGLIECSSGVVMLLLRESDRYECMAFALHTDHFPDTWLRDA